MGGVAGRLASGHRARSRGLMGRPKGLDDPLLEVHVCRNRAVHVRTEILVDEHPDSVRNPKDREDATRARLADERDARADKRDADLNVREALAEAHEAHALDREKETSEILSAADERDDRAETRDRVADLRETAAGLHSFLHDKEYDAALRARRAAALDRADSKTDRTSGASDRVKLSERASEDLDSD